MSKEDVVVEHKSPKCGKPMLAGKLTGDAASTGQATLTWIGNKKGWRSTEHRDSFHNPKGAIVFGSYSARYVENGRGEGVYRKHQRK